MLKHSTSYGKQAASEALVKMADQTVTNEPTDILIRALQDPEADVTFYVYKALEKLSDKAAIEIT
ncbi:unnamed protein product, partial [Rotaria socialis]